ncbi:MAG: diguanylate cyclase [Syntrophaceae bacterium]|nr:diguanylate cyclase [Syntrophaceae bacterium]
MKRAAGHLVLAGLLLAVLFLAKTHSDLLFHAVAEGFSIVIACTIFGIAWNARRTLDNHYFLLVGISLLSAAVLDFGHMLARPGMGVFPGYGANLSAQLWMAARFTESVSFLAAPFFVARTLPAWRALALYALITATLLFAIFTPGLFPDCFLEGTGPTAFKIAGEYVICGILVVSGLLLFRVRDSFDSVVFRLAMAAILVKVVQETAFTPYIYMFGYFRVPEHFLKIVSLWLLYLALIDMGMRHPYDALFRNLMKSEEALRRSEEQFRSLAEESVVGVLVMQDNRIRYANHHLIEMFGYPPDEVINRMSPSDIIVPEDLPTLEGNIRRRLAGDRSITHTPYRAMRKDGTVLSVEVHSAMISYQGRPAIMGTVIDVTDHIQAQEAVRHLAYHDPLTGLPNRALLQDRVETALAVAVRAKRQAALLVLDLDRFKEVNDTFGHALGDQLLTEVAGRLRQAVRESDTVARLGGDEFVVFLPEIGGDKAALRVAEKILESFTKDFVLEGHSIHSSTSIGIAYYPEDGKDCKTLLRKADEAMYRAKEEGGNRCIQIRAFQDPGMSDPSDGQDFRTNSL